MTKVKQIAFYSFYLAVVMEVLIVIVDKSAYTNPIEGRLFQITFLLFLIKVMLTKYSWKEYLAIFLFLLLGSISYFVTGRNEIVRLVMLIAACKDIDMQKCLKLIFYMTLAGSVAIILLSLTGIYGAISLTQEFGRGKVETRYTLGMGHPNALQCMVWALTTLYLYLYGEKIKWYYYIIIFVVNVGFFLLTGSKTSLLSTILVMVLAYMVKTGNNILGKISSIICVTVTLLSILVSVFVAGNAYRVYNYVWYNDRTPMTVFWARLNGILNGRIRILVENDRFEGTMGTWRIFSGPENDHYFDMGWVRLFYWYGVIPACVFIGVLICVMFFCYRKNQYMALVMIASFSFYSIIEAHAISVYLARNYMFFLIGMYWSAMLQPKEGFGNNESVW